MLACYLPSDSYRKAAVAQLLNPLPSLPALLCPRPLFNSRLRLRSSWGWHFRGNGGRAHTGRLSWNATSTCLRSSASSDTATCPPRFTRCDSTGCASIWVVIEPSSQGQTAQSGALGEAGGREREREGGYASYNSTNNVWPLHVTVLMCMLDTCVD